jgi:hypothetical protein
MTYFGERQLTVHKEAKMSRKMVVEGLHLQFIFSKNIFKLDHFCPQYLTKDTMFYCERTKGGFTLICRSEGLLKEAKTSVKAHLICE